MLALHALGVAAVAFCVVMGLWQLGVYDSRQAHERADRQEVPTVPIDTIWGEDEPFTSTVNHRPVTVEGVFAPTSDQMWVAGKEQDGGRGYWLLAPLMVTGSDQALLVVRGWSPEAGSMPEVPAGVVSLRVVLEPGEGSSAPLDDNRVVGSIRIPALMNELPFDLWSGYGLSTTETAADGLALAEPPAVGVSWTHGLRNLAYAVQWWAFGLFALFMWWRITTEQVQKARESAIAERQVA